MGEEWAEVTDAPPIPATREDFGSVSLWRPSGIQLTMSQDPSARIQARSGSGDAMIQVQNGRLHYNWLGRDATGAYPRYPTVRERFDWLLKEFTHFLTAGGFDPPHSHAWEVVYVNQVPRGTLWDKPTEWHRVFPTIFGAAPVAIGQEVESAAASWRLEIAPQMGRLYIEASHVRIGNEECLQLNLTARGSIGPGSAQTLDEGLNLGHRAIVLAFDAAASDAAKAEWGRLE